MGEGSRSESKVPGSYINDIITRSYRKGKWKIGRSDRSGVKTPRSDTGRRTVVSLTENTLFSGVDPPD